jgi:ABC-2 type transport system permease protein
VYGTVFQYNPTFANTTFPQLLTYLFLTLCFRRITINARLSDVLAQEIKKGDFLPYLTKPIDYFKYQLAAYSANFCVLALMSLPFILGAPFLLLENFSLSLFIIPLAFFLCALGFIVLLEIHFIIGLFAFWVEEVWGLKNAVSMIGWLFSGAIIPITLLPVPIQWFAYALPFQHAAAIPAQLILGQKNFFQFGESALILAGWIIALYFIQKWVWKKGLLKHDGKG